MQVAKRAFVLNPRPKFGLPFLTRHLGFGQIPCVLELRHPVLPQDPDEDAAFYRERKPRIGAPGVSLANGEKLSLVNDAGDGKWAVQFEMGAQMVVPAEEVCIGMRTSEGLLHERFLNSEAGQAAFMWVWPGLAVCAEVHSEGPRSVSGLEIDPSLSARSVFELAYHLKTGKVDYDSLLWHEDSSCVQTLDGFVQVGLVCIPPPRRRYPNTVIPLNFLPPPLFLLPSLSRNSLCPPNHHRPSPLPVQVRVETEDPGDNAVVSVPLFVSDEALNLYGRSLLPGGRADWMYVCDMRGGDGVCV